MIQEPIKNRADEAAINGWFEMANVLDRLNRQYGIVKMPDANREKPSKND